MPSTQALFYRGWLVLAAAAMAELLGQGATSYAAGLFVLPLQAEFHISRTAANSPVLILFLGVLLTGPLVGKMLDRYSVRLVMAGGALLLGAAFAAVALAHDLWLMALLLLIPAAIGFMCVGPLTSSALAARWFARRRGLALGIAAVATSGGGLVVVPFLSAAIQAHGWRLALLEEAGAIAAIIAVLSLLFVRDRPSVLGLENHPENLVATSQPVGDLSWRAVLSRRDFWGPSLALAVISGTCQAVVITLVPYGHQLGFAAAAAALLISAFSIAAASVKVMAGFLADYLEQRLLLLAGCSLMVLSLLLLYAASGYGAILAAAMFAGAALGCALPVTAGLLAAGFGAGALGRVMGWTYSGVCLMAIAAVLFIGASYDRSGGYHAGFAVLLAVVAVTLVAVFLITPRTHSA